jgi:hypothetical protein
VNGWRFCVIDPQDAALNLCDGLSDEDGGRGCGYGFGDGDGRGSDYGDADCFECVHANGWGDGYGCGKGSGSSPYAWYV